MTRYAALALAHDGTEVPTTPLEAVVADGHEGALAAARAQALEHLTDELGYTEAEAAAELEASWHFVAFVAPFVDELG